MKKYILNLLNRIGLDLKRNNTDLQGSQRPLSQVYVSTLRNYDLEISEVPIRDSAKANELIEMVNWSYDVRHAIDAATQDIFATPDGDDMGWTISEFLDKHKTVPTHPDVLAILNDLINRKESIDQWVIGGDKLEKAVFNLLGYGDCFLEIGVDKDGSDYCVANTLYLPTWEIFRRETDQGHLEGFDQRRYISSRTPDAEFHPEQIVHLRHRRQSLYGESLWAQSLDKWGNLKKATFALAQAANDIGVNPTLHILPPETTQLERDIYIQSFEAKQLDGIITNMFLYKDQDLRKLQNDFPDLQPLINTCLYWRYQIIPAGFPSWFYPGLDNTGAKDIAGEPARRYGRMRHKWCAILSKGIKQICDTEIVLRKGYDWYKENGQYRIEWPMWTQQQTGLIANGDIGNDGEGSDGFNEKPDRDLDQSATERRRLRKLSRSLRQR
jgi:hypothetical protein